MNLEGARLKQFEVPLMVEDGRISLPIPEVEFSRILIVPSANRDSKFYANVRLKVGTEKANEKGHFPTNQQQDVVSVGRAAIDLLRTCGFKTSLYDRAALLTYIYERWIGDPKHRDVPILHEEWSAILGLNPNWARRALNQLEDLKLVAVRGKIDQGHRGNRYIPTRQTLMAIDPQAISLLRETQGVTYRTIKRRKP